jgi:23S rRNA pseudouridine1911/1915/1917 synthase
MVSLEVLYEDNHLLVVNKPAGLPTQGAAAGHDSLVNRAKEYLRWKYNKPGNVYIGVVSRLDAVVTGLVVLARTSKAAARLSEQFREADVAKIYWAAVEAPPLQRSTKLVDWLAKDEQRRKMVVVGPEDAGAQQASLLFRRLDDLPQKRSLLEVNLETGRKHQIRVQLAHYGCPIVGDFKYGASQPFSSGIALHARRLSIMHPIKHDRFDIMAPLPDSWRSLPLNEERAVKLERESLQ